MLLVISYFNRLFCSAWVTSASTISKLASVKSCATHFDVRRAVLNIVADQIGVVGFSNPLRTSKSGDLHTEPSSI